MASGVLMLAKLAIIQEDLSTNFTCAFLCVTSVKLVAIESDLACGELLATCITRDWHHLIVLLLLLLDVLLSLALRSLGQLVSRWLLLLDDLLNGLSLLGSLHLLGLHRLHLLLLRIH